MIQLNMYHCDRVPGGRFAHIWDKTPILCKIYKVVYIFTTKIYVYQEFEVCLVMNQFQRISSTSC